MVIAAAHRYGIDVHVKRIQDYLDSKLTPIWGNDVNIYGRLHDVDVETGKVLAVYDVKNDYKQVFINDKVNATIGFRIDSRSVNSNRHLATIDVIFSVNVKEAYGENDFNDEKALMHAYKFIDNSGLVRQITGIKQGIDNVLAGYFNDGIKHGDMSPRAMFAITCDIEYFLNACDAIL